MAIDYDSTIQITINVNPAKGQPRAARTAVVDKTMFEMTNLIIENIAFYAAGKQEKALTSNIQRNLSSVVTSELGRMGRSINQLVVGINDRTAQTFVPNESFTGSRGSRAGAWSAGSPPGTLAIAGAESMAMRGLVGPVSLASGTGPWPSRSPKYLKEKKAKVGHTKWFKSTGALGRTLKDPGTYLAAYGPVRVKYTPAPKGTLSPTAIGISNIGTGLPGRRTTRITFGKVEVSVLGRITSDMLNDPGRAQPSPWSTGLFGSLPEEVEKKLLNNEESYRPFLEHFLSYYLTRSIPNAVFRRLERVMANALSSEVNLK